MQLFRLSLILLTLSVFASQSLPAQQITVSDEFQIRTDVDYQILGQFKDRVLLMIDQNTNLQIQAFDANMRSSWEKEIQFEDRQSELFGTVGLEESFILFHHFREKGSTYIRANRYDPSAELKDTATIDGLGYLFFTPDFEFDVSQDQSKTIVFYIEKQNEVTAFGFDNKKMEVLWKKKFMPVDFSIGQDIMHAVIDNRGNMHALFEKENSRARRDNHRYEVVHYGPDFPDPITRLVPMGDNLTYDLVVNYDNQNRKLVAGGLYYQKNPTWAEGYHFVDVPADGGDVKVHTQAFQSDFIETLTGERDQKNPRIEEVVLQEVVCRYDGGIVILGEENRNFQRNLATTNRLLYDGTARNITDFYFEDMFAISIHPDGAQHWSTVMHKKQYSQDDMGAFSSYFAFKNPKQLRLIFNDEIKYENTVSEYQLRGDGSFQRSSLLSTDNFKLRMRFRDALQIGPNRMLVPSERRGRLRVARVELE